jgi:hypothetical protein
VSIARPLRIIVLLAAPFAVGPGIVAAHAASPAALGCAGPPDSAFAQYCEPIPTATGPKTPGPGTPAVATTLPVRITASAAGGAPLTPALTRAGAGAKKRLLTVPAPTRNILAVTTPANANPWSLAWWLILVLALLAAVLVATAVERQRRRRKPAAPPPPA